MSSPEAARAIIEDIRQETILDGRVANSRIATTVRQALKLLSEQLYNKSTRFLLELLQNADDNHYHSEVPTLSITYRPGSVRIDCNEVGFDARNVEAICTIGKSTKAGLDCFTGEKGIGFKSVFKVADAVWITSGNYSFKLDTSEDGELGMIAPRWEAFPESPRHGFTSFYLRIVGGGNEQEIIDEITSMQPTVLLFLRRLKQVELTVTRKDGTVWSEVLQRDTEQVQGVVSLVCNAMRRKYILRRHTINEPPAEPRRHHCSHTELVLAFPALYDSGNHAKELQSVYAFLPIRQYGFEFIVQADFLLTANREDIDQSSHWNIAIRDEIPVAFLDAIVYFNSSSHRYRWPHYLPFGEISPFFRPAKVRIIEDLSKRSILETASGALEKPTALTFVPQELRDCDGSPMSLSKFSAGRYLSIKYPDWEIESILALGVHKMSTREFLEDLRQLSDDFPKKSQMWHSRLAKVLLPFMVESDYRTAIQELSLIPLRSGSWTTPIGRSIYFPEGIRGFRIPNGLELLVVSAEASKDSSRKDFFEQLGVKDCDTLEVCRAIINGPCGNWSIPCGLEREKFVSQTTYLYESSWITMDYIQFWFFAADQKHYRGNTAYIPGSKAYVRKQVKEGSIHARIYDLLYPEFPFLHEDYTIAVQNADENWYSWLNSSFGVSTIPRLLQGLSSEPHIDAFDLRLCGLSEEVKFLFANGDSSDILWFFRENWNAYTEWLEKTVPFAFRKQVMGKIRKEFGSLSVTCSSGRLVPLCNTFLAILDDETESHPNLHILRIDDSRNPSWSFLELFDVVVTANVNYYLRCLELLEGMEPAEDLLLHIYESIQRFYIGNEELLRLRFKKRNLFYLPKHPRKRRTSSAWLSATEATILLVDLEEEYPSCDWLFRCLLITGDGGLEALVAQATLISDSTALSDIFKIFRNLNSTIQKMSPRKAQHALRRIIKHPMFPIITSQRLDGFDSLAQGSDKLYIADKLDVTNSFRGIVPVLAFSNHELAQIQDLLSLMKIKWPLLSESVRSEIRLRGRISVHHSYTKYFRDRVGFLQMLVPNSHKERKKLCAKIEKVEAALTSNIFKALTLVSEGIETRGRMSEETVACSVASDKFQIFLTEKFIEMDAPSLELMESIIQHLQIKEPNHMLLLSLTLSSTDVDQLRAAFAQHGFSLVPSELFQESLPEQEKPIRRYAGSSMELHTISTPVSQPTKRSQNVTDAKYNESLDGIFAHQSNPASVGAERRRKRRKCEPEAVRDMPFLEVIHANTIEVAPRPTSDKLQYIGEVIGHEFLKKHLNELYVPADHWASCKQANWISSEGIKRAAFHLSAKASESMSMLLVRQGYKIPTHWKLANLEYHFETAITAECSTEAFPLSTSQLDRMRRYYLPTCRCTDCIPRHISVLMRISSIYTDPIVDLYIDPWELFTSDRMSFTGAMQLNAILKEPSSPIIHDAELNAFPDHAYHYRAVYGKEIRLLHLLPSCKTESPLRALITHTTFSNAAGFRALSYVWGHGSRPHVLETPEGKLNITSSVDSALRHLRHPQDPIALWVDAVCINQNDNLEKASQLNLLPHIFQNAMSTLVFLTDKAINDRAIEALMQIKAIVTQNEAQEDSTSSLDGSEPNHQSGSLQSLLNRDEEDLWQPCVPQIRRSWPGEAIPPPNDPVWVDIKSFFQDPWFRRIWVVQEVVLASAVRVLSGKWVLDWNDLLGAVEMIDREWCTFNHYETMDKSWEPFMEIATYREREANKNRMALINLLESFRHFQSTLARDRIFALLGLSADYKNDSFQADYESTFEDILCRVAHAFIRQGKILLLLYRGGLDDDNSEINLRFPSWIPNWTKPKHHCLWESSHRGVLFSASWKAEPWVDHNPSSDKINEIAVHGVLIDRVVSISEASCTPDQLSAFLSEVDIMIESNVLEPYLAASISKECLKWQVPVAGARYPRITIDMETDLQSSYNFLKNDLGLSNSGTANPPGSLLAPGPLNSLGAQNASENYKRALFECVEGWRFFVTARGYVGMAPGAVRRDDPVSIFDGSAVPFIIRPSYTKGTENIFRLVGECYVHGLMNGEGEHLENVGEGWICLH